MSDSSRLSFFAAPRNWPLFYHTAANMRLEQVAGVAERKLRHAVVPRLPQDFDAKYERDVPADPTPSPEAIQSNNGRLRGVLADSERCRCRQLTAAATDGEVTLVNDTRKVTTQCGVGWTSDTIYQPPDLWAEQFHGFEFLRWPVLGYATAADSEQARGPFDRWIQDWARAEETRVGRDKYLRRAWTPYSVSLRILNWCRYYAWARSDMDPAAERILRRCIFKNTQFLTNHIEYDVGGNHLVENGAALVAAGLLFETEDQDWASTGLDVLADAGEQFLRDGGHFERSPMYHILALTRYLTVIDMIRATNRQCPDEVTATAESATAFLRALRPPDGEIPLLNDAVLGEGLALEACLAYARAVGVTSAGSSSTRTKLLSSSGYYWLGNGDSRMLVDGGDGGPPHLPGHTHNDPFAVLLWVDGKRLLTDTGVYDYTPGKRRQYARSVCAHNTVQVGEREPVDIGGRYLAGRRLEPAVRYGVMDGITVFEGRYEKRRLCGRAYEHCRRICAGDEWWLVDDRAGGDPAEPVLNRFHCHPEVEVTTGGRKGTDRVHLSVHESDVAAYVHPLSGTVSTGRSRYFPRFGAEQDRPVFRLRRDGSGRLSVLFTSEPHSSVRVERTGWRASAIQLDGESRQLPTNIQI